MVKFLYMWQEVELSPKPIMQQLTTTKIKHPSTQIFDFSALGFFANFYPSKSTEFRANFTDQDIGIYFVLWHHTW